MDARAASSWLLLRWLMSDGRPLVGGVVGEVGALPLLLEKPVLRREMGGVDCDASAPWISCATSVE